MSMCRRDAILRLLAGIQKMVGISSLLPALDQAACPLCKQGQGFAMLSPWPAEGPVSSPLLSSPLPAELMLSRRWKSAMVAGCQTLLSSPGTRKKGHTGLGWVLKTLHAAGNL